MPDHTIVSRYTFPGCTRYIVAPWLSGVGHQHVTIRHSAGVASWMDRDTHLHTDSEEYYFVFQGELRLLVDGTVLTLKPYEVLMVKLGVTHTPCSAALARSTHQAQPQKRFGWRFLVPTGRSFIKYSSPHICTCASWYVIAGCQAGSARYGV